MQSRRSNRPAVSRRPPSPGKPLCGNWPGDPVALFGLANTHLARQQYAAAEAAYRDLLQRQPGLPAARNNLALALVEQGKYDAALQEVSTALSENRDAAVEQELKDTEATIRRRMAGADD